MAEQHLLIVLHDVAPPGWPQYRPFVEALDRLGPLPLSWLVVPDFHHRHPLQASPLRDILEQRLARGDELILHGWYHCDDEPPPRDPRDWFMRRVYTREGEFFRLDEQRAGERLARGIALFQRLGWPLQGFVAPAWLMSAGTRRALAHSGLRYSSDPRNLLLLPDFTALPAPTLVWTSRSAWRRGLSQAWCAAQLRRWQQAPVLRLALHPEDLRHPGGQAFWLATVRRLLDSGRIPLTKSAWLEHCRTQRAAA